MIRPEEGPGLSAGPFLQKVRCTRCFSDLAVTVAYDGEIRCAACQRADPRCAYCFALLGERSLIAHGTRFCTDLCARLASTLPAAGPRARRHNTAVNTNRHRRFYS